jgi:hypothetical protein
LFRYFVGAVKINLHASLQSADQGCQIFWYNIPKRVEIHPAITKLPNLHKIYQNGCNMFATAIKYTNIFDSKALRNIPKLRLLVWKQTIWQPCCRLKKKIFSDRWLFDDILKVWTMSYFSGRAKVNW